MDDLARAACEMLEDDKSTIRSACLRTKLLDAIVERHASHPRVLRAVTKLASVRTGCIALRRHIPLFLEAFRTSTNDEVAQLAAQFLIKMPLWDFIDSTHILHAFRLCILGVVDATTLTTLVMRTAVRVNLLALRQLPELTELPPNLARMFLALVCHPHGSKYAPQVARISECAAVDLFIRSDGDAVCGRLLNVLHPHLTIRSFKKELFFNFAPLQDAPSECKHMRVLASLIFRYMHLDGVFLGQITSTPQWPHFLRHIANALQTPSDPLSQIAPAFLLIVTVRTVKGHEETAPQLRTYLRTNPAAFNFQSTDDATTVERIVACAEALDVNCDAWREQLACMRTREAQRKRLESVGVHNAHQPHEFCCPMTMEVMSDPVVASDGHTYERKALETILTSTKLSPLTRERLDTRIAIPNYNLKKRIRDYPDDLYGAVLASKVQKSDPEGVFVISTAASSDEGLAVEQST